MINRQLSEYNSNLLHIIRIITAETVLIGHLFYFLSIYPFDKEIYFPYVQSLSVIVFLLLSGFLSDYSISRRGEGYTYPSYIKKHFVRMFSYLWVALVFITVIDAFMLHLRPSLYPYSDNFNAITFLKNAFMFPYNYVPYASGRPLWTLYVEWWLYMVFGFLMLVSKRKLQKGKLGLWNIITPLILILPITYNTLPSLVMKKIKQKNRIE